MKQSNKKPFLVNVEIEFAIFAESEKDIYKHPEIRDAIQDGLDSIPSCISFIEPLKRIPDGWDENCYVYGTKNMDCDITIKEALEWNKVSDKVEALNECINKQYHEDAAGHLCDLLAYIANKRNITVTQLLEYYGKNITTISD